MSFIGQNFVQMLRSWSDSQAAGSVELRQHLLQYIVMEHKMYFQQATVSLSKSSEQSEAAATAITNAVHTAAAIVASPSFFPADVDDEHRSSGIINSADGADINEGEFTSSYACFFDSHDRHFNTFSPPSIYDAPSDQPASSSSSQQKPFQQPTTIEEWSRYYSDMASKSTRSLLRELERACYEAGAALCTLGPVFSENGADFNEWLRWALRAEHRRVPMLKGEN
jgi:hypothetical protein